MAGELMVNEMMREVKYQRTVIFLLGVIIVELALLVAGVH
jgi:hypothetical protein